jgi:hypothetical protein
VLKRYGHNRVPNRKKRKDPHAVALGRKGGKARLEKLTPDQRREIAKKAVNARWERQRQKKTEEDKNID